MLETSRNVSISFNAGNYEKLSEKNDCAEANLLIKTQEECKKAAGLLGLTFPDTYSIGQPGRFPSKCGYDTTGMAYFNQANTNPGPTNLVWASNGGICKTKGKNRLYNTSHI